jgi:dTDP-4-dehydrorhamnose reductase
MINIMVTGGSGRLATELSKINDPNTAWILLPKEDCDITDKNSINYWIKQANPDAVLHAGALTNPMEVHEINTTHSIDTNIIGTCNVVNACLENDIPRLIYISTDYVYASRSWSCDEDSPVGPCNNYGRSKLAGELAVQMMPLSRYLIIRTTFTERPFRHKKAYSDSYKSLMFIDKAAELIHFLVSLKTTGIYNVGGKNSESIYNFALNHDYDVEPISRASARYEVPENTSLDVSKLQSIIRLNNGPQIP